MVIGDAQVVNDFPLARVVNVLDGYPLAVIAQQIVANRKLIRVDPALIVREKRVLAGRADDLAANVQIQDRGRAAEEAKLRRPYVKPDYLDSSWTALSFLVYGSFLLYVSLPQRNFDVSVNNPP